MMVTICLNQITATYETERWRDSPKVEVEGLVEGGGGGGRVFGHTKQTKKGKQDS